MVPFFNRNWAGARRGRWAGPELSVGWGCRLLDRQGWGRTAVAMLDCRLRVWHFSAKGTRKKGVRRGLRSWSLRCLSQFLSERKERLLRGGRICLVWRCVSEFAYLSPMGWPCIYSGCPTSWTVTRGPSYWMECFLFYPISDLVQDIERVIYLK